MITNDLSQELGEMNKRAQAGKVQGFVDRRKALL
jgi:hypothetical protein